MSIWDAAARRLLDEWGWALPEVEELAEVLKDFFDRGARGDTAPGYDYWVGRCTICMHPYDDCTCVKDGRR